MKFDGKSLTKSYSVYTVSSIISAGIPFFILPILTNYISTSDYGLLANFKIIFSLILAIMGLSVVGAISRMYYEKNSINFPVYLTNGIFIILVNAVVIGFILLLSRSAIYNLTKIPPMWLLVAIVIALSYNLTLIILTVWRLQMKAFSYGVLNIVRSILNFGLSALFVIVFYHSWKGRIEGELIAVGFFAILSVWLLNRDKLLNFRINKKYLKDILLFGLPLIPHSIGSLVISFSDRIIITNLEGLSSTGLYSVGLQVAALISILFNSFILAWIPWLYKKLKDNKTKDKKNIVKVTYLYFIALIILVIIVHLISPTVFKTFIGKGFQAGQVFVFWLALGISFNGMYRIVVPYLFYLKKTYVVGIISVVIALTNIVLNFVLIKKYGAIGAAQATCISFFLQFALTWFFAGKHFKMPWFSFLEKQDYNKSVRL